MPSTDGAGAAGVSERPANFVTSVLGSWARLFVEGAHDRLLPTRAEGATAVLLTQFLSHVAQLIPLDVVDKPLIFGFEIAHIKASRHKMEEES